MFSVIELRKLHAVVVDHSISGDDSLVALNQQDGGFLSVQLLQFFCAGTSAVDVHVVVTTNCRQVRKIRNYSYLLAAEAQIDEVFHACEIELFSHCLKLRDFFHIKAIQAFYKVVQLIQVDFHALQTVQYRPCIPQIIQTTVSC